MAIILGHSQLKYFREYVKDPSIQCIFSSGCTVEVLVTFPGLEEAIPASKVIAVHCGINNLPRDDCPTLLVKFQRLYDRIKELNPTATVIFSSILPRATSEFSKKLPTETLQRINSTAGDVNRALKEVSSLNCYPDVEFISHDCEFQKDGILQRRMLSRDGLHLSFMGTEILVNRIVDEIQRVMVEKATSSTSTQPPKETQHESENSMSPKLTSVIEEKKTSNALQRHQLTETNQKPTSCQTQLPTREVHSKQTSASMKPSPLPRHKTFRPCTIPSGVFTTTWCQAVRSQNIFELLTCDDDNKVDEADDDDDYESESNIVVSCITKTLHGGGAECEETDIVLENENDDFDSVVYMECDMKLKHSEIADILENPDVKKVSTLPPFKPKGGTVYLITDGQRVENKDDWRADGYSWRNYGKSKVTDGDKVLEKSYFRIKNGKEESDYFQRIMMRFFGSDYNHLTVVQYVGKETEYKGEPHGNRKKGFRPHQRTKPSVLNKIKLSEDENPKSVKDKLDSECSVPAKLSGISSVRNNKQISNVQYNKRKERKLGQDSLYNLHELVYHLESYIHEIKTTPDLQVVLGSSDIFQEFDRLLQLKNSDPVTLYYDTTFCLGDFYVSTLAFQHIMFEENPAIPLGFMVHERKFQKCHEQFLEMLKEKIPRLGKKNVPIVTDREMGIVNAIKKVLPNAHLLICWNHILRDLKFWLSKHGATQKDLSWYESHIKQLLHCENENEFKTLLAKLRVLWSPPMVDYFDNNLLNTIEKFAGRWILDELDLYNPYSGITNNCSESINAKLKRLTEWKEREVDNIVLFLYYMQSNDLADLMKSFCGIGEFNLMKKYKYALRDPETVILPKRVCHPDKIIEKIKGELRMFANEDKHLDLVQETKENSTSSEIATFESDNGKQINEKQTNTPARTKKYCSQKSLAQDTINDHGIVLAPEMKCFVVKGSRDQKYAVTLFPKETCPCPSTRRCRHILSAMMAIGIEPAEDKRAGNLTALRKNSRARKDKKAGTKRGRKGDVDETSIIAAPDSILMNQTNQEDSEPEENLIIPHSTPKPFRSKEHLNLASTPILSPQTPKTPKVVIVSPTKTPKSILKKSSKKHLFESENANSPAPKRTKLELPHLPNIDEDDKDEEILMDINESRDDTNEDLSCPVFKNQSPPKSEPFWKKSLGLTTSDKTSIINNGKLNSQIIEAVNILARKQFPMISSLQLPEKVPEYLPNEKRWHVQKQTVMNSVPKDKSLACQIHHTGRDHWIISFRDETDSIFMFDSLGFDRQARFIMTPSLSIQLGLMYGSNTDHDLEVILIDTQKQTNGVDCGVFAIAHLVEFCTKLSLNPTICFDTKKMRTHLISCIEAEYLTCFPTISKRPIRKGNRTNSKSIPINLHCHCRLPNCVGEMVKCEGCKISYHKFCVKKQFDFSCPSNKFVCDTCLK